MTTKYEPFIQFLNKRKSSRIHITFAEIEKQLGFSLPASARSFRSWWSNNPGNSVMTKAWTDAGYKSTEVDVAGEKLVFVREREMVY